jgi:acetolactate synthase I/II/III large subunit
MHAVEGLVVPEEGRMETVEGGALLVRMLERLGVSQAFSVSGGPINSFYNACAATEALHLRHVRHEAAAGFMAEACYRATGTPGVAVVTLGPGVTNAVTPCVSASLAGVPLLVVGGQAGTATFDKGAGMSTDTLSVMRTVTKWAAQVHDVARIPEYVAEAWRRMHAPTPGPVYLEIPVDVLSGAVPDTTARELVDGRVPVQASQSAPDATAVARALDMVASGPRRLVLLGDDCFRTADPSRLERFIQLTGSAFATMRLARGAVPETHPSWIGPGYTPCNPVLRRALAEADVVLLLGHEWEFDLDFGDGLGPQAQVVQVNPDASRLGRNGAIHLGVPANAGPFVAGCLDAGLEPTGADNGWLPGLADEWRQLRADTAAQAASSQPLHPITVAEAVTGALPEHASVVTSHGNVDFWIDQHVIVTRRGGYLRAGQSGTLGAEIPYGVAAALATGGPAVVFVGDGGVGYALLELDTAARYGANVLVVVADDELWAAISIPQARAYGRPVELDLPRRDWAAAARSLGAQGVQATTAEEVAQATESLLAADGPGLLHVPIRAVESPYMNYISR